MLWSLVKIILFLTLIAAAAWGAGYLLEADGGIRLSIADTELTLGPLASVIGLLVLVVAIWLLLKVVGLLVAFMRFVAGDETAITRYFSRNRERKGYDALSEGMMALASGDGRLALAKANKAEKLLKRTDLTLLLTAQAAEQSGDRARAEDAFKKLLKDDRTRFVGVRGLMKQKLEDGDTDTAMKLAERAFALKPKHTETQDVLLGLQASAHEWSSARQTLTAKLKHGSLPRDVHKRRDAVLALGEARDILIDDKPIEAREAAIEANRKSPDLIPAAVMASDSYVAQGKPKNAARVIRKAWQVMPHPDLAAAFARIKPEETPKDRIHRFSVLTNHDREGAESRMLAAELRIAAEDFPGAREALGDLAEKDPTARSLTIMAAIERGAGADDAVVKGWLARALTASRGPQWVCDKCQKVHATWDPMCSNCDGFDTLSWRVAKEDVMPMASGAAMLPLIVGQIEDASDEAEEDAEIVEDEVADAVDEADSEALEDGVSDIANADAPPADYIADESVAEEQRKDAT
ncbi:MAG: heme biosynthesis HemY N-terminal domain-containing protein [Paracoccaceae bacterium]